MKNKIGNNGFTLIELVATIALLAVIALISFVSITSILEKTKIQDCKNLIKSIDGAAREYVSDNRYKNTFNEHDGEEKIGVNLLVDGNYLSSPVIEPFNRENIQDNTVVGIILNDYYEIEQINVYSNNELVNCEDGKW